MRQALVVLIFSALTLAVATPARAGKYPEPSIYPIKWEFDFKHGTPRRVVVNSIGYWYLSYTVTNNTGQEQLWAPDFKMMASDGSIIQSDRNIPAEVFDRIKGMEKNRFLQPANQVSGSLRQGPDQARDGVAIWKEPNPRMGNFKIFVGNLSGEYAILKDDDGKEMKTPDGDPMIVRKTLELDYAVYGDEFYPEHHEVHELGHQWVMR
jgi:hypothetical protein